MGLKKYIIASLILIIAIGGYTFSIESGDYRVQIIDQVFIFPVALWIVLPTIILFIVTLFHMLYYGLKTFLLSRSMQKDNEQLISIINKRLLGEDSIASLKTQQAKEIANILSQMNVNINDTDFSTSNTKIKTTVDNIVNIQAGKYISIKDFKLPNKNILMEKNLENRVDIDANFGVEVLKQPTLYTQKIIKHAFINTLNNKPISVVKKIIEDITLDDDMLQELIEKDSKGKSEDALSNTILFNLIIKIKLSNKQLIKLAQTYEQTVAPERLIKLFEDLMTKDEQLTESYLYVLSQYEMISDMREILVNSQKNEFLVYKAYLDLKDSGKHYSLDTFI